MAYSEDQVDDLFAKFEKCAQRQNANKSSPVKLRAAEGDLLRATEEVRNLLLKAVKGDRDLLVKVFGGNCRRFHLFRQIMETVELSQMYAKDPRWQQLISAMETIEEILKQLGTFNMWAGQSNVPPEITSYKGLRERFTPGTRVWMRPECDGAEAESFTVSPALPQGLVLNASSGEISGSLKPGVEVPSTTYVVTASNKYGNTDVELTFTVAPPAPSSVVYAEVPSLIHMSEVVDWTAEVEGGPASKWSVSPPLPPGLSLDPNSGAISGVPTSLAEPTEYTVTAGNVSGGASVSISFGVKPAPPVSLEYVDAKDTYSPGAVIYLRPEVKLKTSSSSQRPISAKWNALRSKFLKSSPKQQKMQLPDLTFSVEPALPGGLTLAVKSGVISGNPSAAAEEATYTVTCRSESGQVSAELSFSVKAEAPSSLTYPQASERYFVGQPFTLNPKVQGSVSEWSVEPALPPGFQLDPMGVITGVPTEVVPEGSWTVTARNAEGEVSSALTFSVHRPAPSGLEYPALLEDYPVLRSLALQPTVEGQVDEFTVEPALPPGLTLDPKTGVIEGMPSATMEKGSYTVTARNETGVATVPLVFGIKVMPPESLAYPQVDDVYTVGECVGLEPQVEGGATSWTVEPALPPGLELDPQTGKISGTAAAPADEASYVITASNEAGGTSTVLTFAVTAPPPEGLHYPSASSDYSVGLQVLVEPQLRSGVCATFTIEPALPEGLQLDPLTGAIHGSPEAESERTAYTVTATNKSGSCSAELTFSCSKEPEEDSVTGVNLHFAASIEEITDIADLCDEPGRTGAMGDWMIWMVHRAWLDDPSLIDFNFGNKRMPPPHMEPRIAPKLMKAMAHNTHILSLHLANSNLMKPQGPELADSLKKNRTVRVVNIETNNLDSDGITQIAKALKENEECAVEQFRCNNQASLGDFFGRPVEQAFAELVEVNTTIVKLGFKCNDAHWRLKIDRALLRNNDLARRRRKGSAIVEEVEEIAAQDKPLARLSLVSMPEKPFWEIFELEDGPTTIARTFVSENKRLPTKEQLQSFARSRGAPIPYSKVAPLVKEFRAKLVSAAVNSDVLAHDIYGVEFPGCLRAWAEKNERWSLDIWKDGSTRYNFVADKTPIIDITAELATWLCPPE